jgi:TonB family protein
MPDIDLYYPQESRAAGEEGTIKVRACFDLKGRVATREISESSGNVRLDEAAIRFARAFMFQPRTRNASLEPGCALFAVKFSTAPHP